LISSSWQRLQGPAVWFIDRDEPEYDSIVPLFVSIEAIASALWNGLWLTPEPNLNRMD
jgi:hypothetical protein